MINMATKEVFSAMLDGEVTPDELGSALVTLRSDGDGREDVTAYQMIKDALAGHRALDDGYTVRILARLAARRARGKTP